MLEGLRRCEIAVPSPTSKPSLRRFVGCDFISLKAFESLHRFDFGLPNPIFCSLIARTTRRKRRMNTHANAPKMNTSGDDSQIEGTPPARYTLWRIRNHAQSSKNEITKIAVSRRDGFSGLGFIGNSLPCSVQFQRHLERFNRIGESRAIFRSFAGAQQSCERFELLMNRIVASPNRRFALGAQFDTRRA